jgi:uncharacterized phage protein (TIGR01671 family)
MREIRFRAWDKIEKKMYDCNFLSFCNGGIIFFDTNKEDEYLCIQCKDGDFELMQFTGYYDKNQVPIYEGDVIKCYVYEKGIEANFEFDLGSWVCYYKKGTDDQITGFLNHILNMEVVGNIYEERK